MSEERLIRTFCIHKDGKVLVLEVVTNLHPSMHWKVLGEHGTGFRVGDEVTSKSGVAFSRAREQVNRRRTR